MPMRFTGISPLACNSALLSFSHIAVTSSFSIIKTRTYLYQAEGLTN